jgi:hypothetical protein
MNINKGCPTPMLKSVFGDKTLKSYDKNKSSEKYLVGGTSTV